MQAMNTYHISLINFGTMSQQNRQAFMMTFLSSKHVGCVAILQLTTETE
jgi:hypothetical protein